MEEARRRRLRQLARGRARAQDRRLRPLRPAALRLSSRPISSRGIGAGVVAARSRPAIGIILARSIFFIPILCAAPLFAQTPPPAPAQPAPAANPPSPAPPATSPTVTAPPSPAQPPVAAPPAHPTVTAPVTPAPKPASPPRGPTVPTYIQGPDGSWVPFNTPTPGSDEGIIAQARKDLAENHPQPAYDALNAWIEKNDRTGNPNLPAAFLARADATTALGDEYAALYDYEQVIQHYPGSPEYVTAIERELEIARAYIHGLDRKLFGLRWFDATPEAEEILIRVQERLPNSELAERAGLELADHYYREADLPLAATAYELFVANYPNSPYKMLAMERRIAANIGRYKGPQYNGTALLDAAALIRRFRAAYPAESEHIGFDGMLVYIDESSAEHLELNAQWYMKRDDLVSARFTLRKLVERFPQTAAAGRALDILTARGWLVPTKPAKPASASASPASSSPSSSTTPSSKP